MLGKTHFTIGIATALAVARPDTVSMVVLVSGAGAIGGVIPDIDIDSTDAHEGASFVTVLALLAVSAVLALDRFNDMGIVERLMTDENRWRTILSALMFIGVCAIGKNTRHRSFMHSILAMIILSTLMGIMLPSLVFPFVSGYASHLVLDVFNRKGEQLLFPYPRRFCLNLCDSNGLVNRILCFVGVAVSVVLAFTSLNIIKIQFK